MVFGQDLYTHRLRSQPSHHAGTKGRSTRRGLLNSGEHYSHTRANVATSQGEDVNRYQGEDPDGDKDRERHQDLHREHYPSLAKPLSFSLDPRESNLRSQSNNQDRLVCPLMLLSIGKRTLKASEYELKMAVENKWYSLHIGDLKTDTAYRKYMIYLNDFKAFQFYNGPSYPTGFLWSMKSAGVFPEYCRDYNPDSTETKRKFIIGIVSEKNKKVFEDILSQVSISGRRAEPIDDVRWATHLEDYEIQESSLLALLEEPLSPRETQRYPEKSNSVELSETPVTSSRQVDTKARISSTQYKKSRSPSPQHREMRSLRTSPLLSDRTLFVYPFRGVGAVTMTKDDVSRLSDGEFLNDNIIEFYLKWYFDQLKEHNPSLADKVHIFNSFFYKRLTQKAKSNKNEDSYDRVKKWTSKVDLFSKQYIFMPVNESLHWYLVLICNHDLMLPQNSRRNPIDLDAEVTAPPITTAEPLNSQTTLEDGDIEMEEQATVPRLPSPPDMHRVSTDDLIQKISVSKSEMDNGEWDEWDDIDESIVRKAPIAVVDYESESDRDIPKDSNTLKIESDDMDIDTTLSQRVSSRETPEAVTFSQPKSKKRLNGSKPAQKPPHIVIKDEQGERHQSRTSSTILTRGRSLTTGHNSNKSGPFVVEASLSPEPKRPRFDGDDDDDDEEFPTPEEVASKRSEIVSPPPSSDQKKGRGKKKEAPDPNIGPWIIIFDSLGSKHPNVFKTIKNYLKSEAKEKRKVDVNSAVEIISMYAKVPNQTNHCDCGVYLLHYVDKFLGDPEKYLQLVVNREDNKEAWSPSEVHSKRQYIRNLIYDTAETYQSEIVKERSLQEK